MPRDLRYPLVRDAFLAGAVTLSLTSVLSSLGEPTSALQPLIGAVRLGATIDRQLLETLLQASSDPDDFAMYATLGEREATRTLEIAPTLRQPIALASLGVAPKLGVKLLLDDSVGDDRPRHSHPDHPMRELRDFVGSRYVGVSTRVTVMEAIEEWLDSGGDHDVALEAMCLVLRPAWEGRETDPGRGMTITISAGLVSLNDLRALVPLLDAVISRVCKMRPNSYEYLAGLFHDWCFAGGLTFGQASPDPTWSRIARSAVRASIERLAVCIPTRVGVIARLRRMAQSAGVRVRVQSVAEFETLFPDNLGSDWQAAERRQRTSATQLAREWQSCSPAKLADRLSLYEKEARAAGLTFPRWTPFVCSEIAKHAVNRLSYVRAFSACDAPDDLLGPFLELAIVNRDRGVRQIVEGLMDHSMYSHLAIIATLRYDALPHDLMTKAVAACTGSQKNALEAFALRKELQDAAIAPLLAHPNPLVARSVAIGMRDDVPESIRAVWEDTIVRCPADQYWYSVILKQNPALFGRWLVAFCVRDQASENQFESIPHTLSEAITGLSQLDRLEMLRTMPSSPRNPWLDDVIRRIVGDDARVFGELLKRDDLKAFHSDGLAGRPSESWFARADVALECGWSPERIVSAVMFSERGWSGDQSAHWQAWHNEFEAFLKGSTGGRRKVIEAALAQFQIMRDRALEEERREAVTGLS